MRHLTLLLAALALAVAAPAIAGKGGNGNGGGHGNGSGDGNGNVTTASGSCTVSGATVTATGLPTDQVINFLITEDNGSGGWVLGFTDDGTWSVTVPAATAPTTYEFVSRTWGPSGTKYDVFASCSA